MQTVNGTGNDAFDEEVFPNCTVIQLTNLTTGEKQFCWWDNDNPGQTYQQEEENV